MGGRRGPGQWTTSPTDPRHLIRSMSAWSTPPPGVTFRRVVAPLRALDSHPFSPSHVASGRCVLSAAAAGALAGVVSAFAEPSSWCVGAVLTPPPPPKVTMVWANRSMPPKGVPEPEMHQKEAGEGQPPLPRATTATHPLSPLRQMPLGPSPNGICNRP